MSPIVPGRGRQALYPDRPCLLQQLWTSPHLSAALLLHLLQLLPVLPPLLNINPSAAGLGHKEEEERGEAVLHRRPYLVGTKGRNRGRISDIPAELTAALHRAIKCPRKKTGSALRGLSFSFTVAISAGLSPAARKRSDWKSEGT